MIKRFVEQLFASELIFIVFSPPDDDAPNMEARMIYRQLLAFSSTASLVHNFASLPFIFISSTALMFTSLS
jgi:hypothetical protein